MPEPILLLNLSWHKIQKRPFILWISTCIMRYHTLKAKHLIYAPFSTCTKNQVWNNSIQFDWRDRQNVIWPGPLISFYLQLTTLSLISFIMYQNGESKIIFFTCNITSIKIGFLKRWMYMTFSIPPRYISSSKSYKIFFLKQTYEPLKLYLW